MVIKAAVASEEQGLCLSAGLSPRKTLNRQQEGSFREQLLNEASETGLGREDGSQPRGHSFHADTVCSACLGLGRTPWPLLSAWATMTPAHRLPACNHKKALLKKSAWNFAAHFQ